MEKNIDPALFGLSSRITLKENKKGDIILEKMRKSRIVMKDGTQILKIRDKIMQKGLKGSSFILRTNAPLCSKTRHFLEEAGIGIEIIP